MAKSTIFFIFDLNTESIYRAKPRADNFKYLFVKTYSNQIDLNNRSLCAFLLLYGVTLHICSFNEPNLLCRSTMLMEILFFYALNIEDLNMKNVGSIFKAVNSSLVNMIRHSSRSSCSD